MPFIPNEDQKLFPAAFQFAFTYSTRPSLSFVALVLTCKNRKLSMVRMQIQCISIEPQAVSQSAPNDICAVRNVLLGWRHSIWLEEHMVGGTAYGHQDRRNHSIMNCLVIPVIRIKQPWHWTTKSIHIFKHMCWMQHLFYFQSCTGQEGLHTCAFGAPYFGPPWSCGFGLAIGCGRAILPCILHAAAMNSTNGNCMSM